MSLIKLESNDNEIFEVDIKVAKMSVTIKTMLEDLGLGDDDDEVVPLPNVNSAILKKVIEWAEYHKDDPPAPEEDQNQEKRCDDISVWDSDFLKVDQPTLFAIIRAANYLDIKGLMDVTCKTVANMIKGKTPDEIRKTFNLSPMKAPGINDDVSKTGENWSMEKDNETNKENNQ
ncbi:S-phase kinase-associated protein 1-like [Microplitis demolitor]|uniref:S-phase kinase-associated protein 1-like n=1 Tax=Microplitis demolitor TaxID=69319 RepID=UPI00235B5BB4|nr:S-phase kinase-associated protein 1-like [Microplitis demolitor]